jgi:hypothetical protein
MQELSMTPLRTKVVGFLPMISNTKLMVFKVSEDAKENFVLKCKAFLRIKNVIYLGQAQKG